MRKINLYLILFAFFILSCKSKQVVFIEGIPSRTFEPGKHYSSIKTPKERGRRYEAKPFILELIPATYEQKLVKLNKDQYHLQDDGTDSIYIIPPAKYFCAIKFKNEELAEFVSSENPKGFLLHFYELRPEFKRYSKEKLEQDDFFFKRKVEKTPYRIVKRSVRRKPKILKENQYFFEAGYYTRLREELRRERGHYDILLKVKTKLIGLGYDLKNDNHLNGKVKEAIIDYQRKNGLNEGQLDFETIRHLGIEY